MKIWNEQGARALVVDHVAPVLEHMKELLPLFEEPDVYVGEGGMTASLHLSSKGKAIPAEALERALGVVRKRGLFARVTADYRYGCNSGDHRIVVNIYGFLVF